MFGDRTGTELHGLEKSKNSCEKPEIPELYIAILKLEQNHHKGNS
jgi:hypothetical protein